MRVQQARWRFWRLPLRRKALLLPALCLLCWATVCVRWLPFKHIASFLGDSGHVAQGPLTPAQLTVCQDWAWVLGAVARRLPWTATCLMLALAGQVGLRRHGVPATVYLGVAYSQAQDTSPFDAHAWLCCEGEYVTGAHEAARFKPIAWFATRQR